MKKKPRNNVRCGNLILVSALFLFLVLIARGTFLALSTTVDGVNLKEFASQRTTRTEVLPAKRGTIYDCNGEVLAQNVYSYTLIAYLDPSRTTNEDNPKHVVDKNLTAEKLAPVLGMSKEEILAILENDTYIDSNGEEKQRYQTEFGTKGRGLSELTRDQIVALQLPGLDFIESQKRYYPNGNFLSYTIGYAKSDSEGTIVGEMGIEKHFDEELSGTPGYITYQKDLRGYQIPNTPEIREDAISGKDVYLTIDNNIQFFVEQAIKEAAQNYTFETMNIMIASAKTGEILASSTFPSFDPNIRDITNYLDPNISIPFEPGSTMKIFSYLAVMEAGVYDGNATFESGVYVTSDGTEIGDSNREGWGTISYDRGFALSSNVGVINLIEHYIDAKTLKDYYLKLGFGSPTGIMLPNEASGKIDFKYETEVFNAGFGQGILTTPIQYIKALTSVANDGVLLQPYIVSKIVDPDTGEVIFEGSKQELGRVASSENVSYMINLMRSVVQEGTGTPYRMDGYDIAAKTGTAQISSTDGTGYLKGENDVIRGFAGIYPASDPEFIIYATVKRPNPNTTAPLSNAIKSIIENIAKYKNYDVGEEPVEAITELALDSYYNQDITSVTASFQKQGIETVVIGNGDKVIKQYPAKGMIITSKEKVFLVTNGSEIRLPNFNGWSRKEVDTYLSMIGLTPTYEGTGYVTSQSIGSDTVITPNMTTIAITLQPKFVISEETRNDT